MKPQTIIVIAVMLLLQLCCRSLWGRPTTDWPATGVEESQTASAALARLSTANHVLISGVAGGHDRLEALSAASYDYYIQVDSHQDNEVRIAFGFLSNPGEVFFSRSPACGGLEPAQASAKRDPDTGAWWVTTKYNPCENECSSIAITAKSTSGQSQTKTVHIDDRYHIGCVIQEELGVSTCTPDEDDPTKCYPNQAYVRVTVLPGDAGTVSPSSGDSQYNPLSGLYEFWSTYKPDCSYQGRVRVKFTLDNDWPIEDDIIVY